MDKDKKGVKSEGSRGSSRPAERNHKTINITDAITWCLMSCRGISFSDQWNLCTVQICRKNAKEIIFLQILQKYLITSKIIFHNHTNKILFKYSNRYIIKRFMYFSSSLASVLLNHTFFLPNKSMRRLNRRKMNKKLCYNLYFHIY